MTQSHQTLLLLLLFYCTNSDIQSGNPALFEYHYISPFDEKNSNVSAGAETSFPLAEVSKAFTELDWLADMGER